MSCTGGIQEFKVVTTIDEMERCCAKKRAFVVDEKFALSVKELPLSGCRMCYHFPDCLKTALAQFRKLELLHFSSNHIHADDAEGLASALEQMPFLKSFRIDSSSLLGSRGMFLLAPVIGRMKVLHTLSMSSVHMKEEGARALIPVLPQLSLLRNLWLASNFIGNNAATALADVLPRMESLQTITLRCNLIGADGARALAAAFTRMGSLTYIGMANNEIGDSGAVALAAAFGKMRSIRDVFLGNNSISSYGEHALTYFSWCAPFLVYKDIYNDPRFTSFYPEAQAERRLENHRIWSRYPALKESLGRVLPFFFHVDFILSLSFQKKCSSLVAIVDEMTETASCACVFDKSYAHRDKRPREQ